MLHYITYAIFHESFPSGEHLDPFKAIPRNPSINFRMSNWNQFLIVNDKFKIIFLF